MKPTDVLRIQTARSEWDAACQAAHELQNKIFAFKKAAMAQLKVSTSCRNHDAWTTMFDLYCQQISREWEAADNAIYALAFSIETAAHLATFAELDVVQDGADHEGGEHE